MIIKYFTSNFNSIVSVILHYFQLKESNLKYEVMKQDHAYYLYLIIKYLFD